MLVDDPVKRVDNMTMAHGLEARTPFLDHELVELAARIPPELKLADGGKGILKAASRGVVPDAVIDREKGYFPVPALSHLEEPVLGMVREALLAPEARERGLFRARRRRGDARRPQRPPHEPRRLVAVAARPARAVAAGARGMSAGAVREVAVVGGGQAGLAMGHHLARRGFDFTILEAGDGPAEAWLGRWDSLRLFTPARRDALPGRPFPGDPDRYPTRDEVVAYLTAYAAELPVEYGSRVRALRRDGESFRLELDDRVVEATPRPTGRGGDRPRSQVDKWRSHPAVRELARDRRTASSGRCRRLHCRRVTRGHRHDDVDTARRHAPHDLAIALEILGATCRPPRARRPSTRAADAARR